MIWPVAVALTVLAPTAALTVTAGKLGAPDHATRESAARSLFAAGKQAVAPLTAAARSPNPEVRRRSADLLDRLEAVRLGGPTRVTVHADRRPLSAVAADLQRQTGYPLTLSENAGGIPVTLHRDHVPFWTAVDALCEAGGLSANVQDDSRVALFPADATDPFVCYAGPFRVAATGINAGQHRQLAGLPRKGLPAAGPEPLHLSFTLSAEPKAAVVGVGQPTVFAADDDRGLSLKPAPDAERASYYPPAVGHRALVHGFAVGLHRPDKGGTVIRRLRGTVPVAVLAGTSPDAVLPDPAAGRVARGKASDLTVKSLAEADGLLTLEVTVVRTAASPDGWQAGLPQRLELAGADGTPWAFAGVASQTSGPQSSTLAVQFRPPTTGAKPARLTLVEWRTVTREVTFEFADIPLP